MIEIQASVGGGMHERGASETYIVNTNDYEEAFKLAREKTKLTGDVHYTAEVCKKIVLIDEHQE